MSNIIIITIIIIIIIVVVVGLGVMYSPQNTNPAEVDGFYSGRKNPEHKSSGKDFKPGVPGLLKNLKPEKKSISAKFNQHIHILVIP